MIIKGLCSQHLYFMASPVVSLTVGPVFMAANGSYITISILINNSIIIIFSLQKAHYAGQSN
jgi:hypothetical protein